MKDWKPTIQQERMVDALLEGKTIVDAAEYANVTRQSFYEWKRKPEFMAYFEQRRREVASSRTPRVDNALFQKCLEGDPSALRIWYEVFGGLRAGLVTINNTQPSVEEEPGKKILSMLDELEEKRKAKLNVSK